MNDTLKSDALRVVESLDKCFNVPKNTLRASNFVKLMLKNDYDFEIVNKALSEVLEKEERYPSFALFKKYLDTERAKQLRQKHFVKQKQIDSALDCMIKSDKGKCGLRRGTEDFCKYCDAKKRPLPSPDEVTKMLKDAGLIRGV